MFFRKNATFLWLFFSRFTARITELMKVLKELNAGKYERTMVTQQDKGTQQKDPPCVCSLELSVNSFYSVM